RLRAPSSIRFPYTTLFRSVEAQENFDRYATPACPEELTAPVLHRTLSYEPLKRHILGGKGVGSQGDGTAQFITRSRTDQQAVMRSEEHTSELQSRENLVCR